MSELLLHAYCLHWLHQYRVMKWDVRSCLDWGCHQLWCILTVVGTMKCIHPCKCGGKFVGCVITFCVRALHSTFNIFANCARFDFVCLLRGIYSGLWPSVSSVRRQVRRGVFSRRPLCMVEVECSVFVGCGHLCVSLWCDGSTVMWYCVIATVSAVADRTWSGPNFNGACFYYQSRAIFSGAFTTISGQSTWTKYPCLKLVTAQMQLSWLSLYIRCACTMVSFLSTISCFTEM